MSQSLIQSGPGAREFCQTLAKDVSPEEFQRIIEDFASLKVLVVGDTIFDRYSYLTVQGLTSKNRIISGRYLNEETQCGGALAVFRHVRRFVDNARFVSIVGDDPWVEAALQEEQMSADEDRVIRDPDFTTIVKQRFVEPVSEGKEMSKLFSVNFIDADPPSAATLDRAVERIRGEIAWADVVLVTDFGHGLFQGRVRDLVQDESPFLALNCQTNSNNHGFNIISRQYRRADAFTLDQQELMLSAGHRHLDFREALETLRGQLSAKAGWLTRGPVETIGVHEGGDVSLCPPLEVDVLDTIGAGDAFFSVVALAAVRGVPMNLSTFIGQLAGAQAVKVVGNAAPVSKETLLETGRSLLGEQE